MIPSVYRIAIAALLLTMIMAPLAIADPPAGDNPTASTQTQGAPPYSCFRQPPANAVILFNGKDLDNWHQPDGQPPVWEVKDGAMTVTAWNIMSRETFADAFIHIEFREPDMPQAKGQAKGNSGIFLQGRYEIQVLDSYGIKIPGKGDCGAVYAQYAPLVNACKPPLEWQSYDIIFRAPRVDSSGKVTELGRVTLLQNDTVIQNNVEVLGPNVSPVDMNLGQPGPLVLQAHGSPVEYRNIWLVHLPPKGSDTYEPR